jgi:hypothetical protein
LTECQKYAWTKLPDVCQYEGKKTQLGLNCNIFVSMETKKKKNKKKTTTKEQS